VLKQKPQDSLDGLLGLLRQVVGPTRTLLMPTFTHGFRDGLCDLDHEPSSTGLISEAFRRTPGTRRTLSAFFPFSVQGLERDDVCTLVADSAWGEGSLYEWLEQRNCRFLMLGTHPTHCSYLHRMEWLMRESLPYRYMKNFHGRIRREGQEQELTERLYVRSLAPEAKNDLTVLVEPLRAGGMDLRSYRGVPVAAMNALPMRDAVLAVLAADPLALLANRQDFTPTRSGAASP
jgi:aminoglycoside N3'-acetyltransferase